MHSPDFWYAGELSDTSDTMKTIQDGWQEVLGSSLSRVHEAPSKVASSWKAARPKRSPAHDPTPPSEAPSLLCPVRSPKDITLKPYPAPSRRIRVTLVTLKITQLSKWSKG